MLIQDHKTGRILGAIMWNVDDRSKERRSEKPFKTLFSRKCVC
jgi:hypothetical protein